MPRRAIGAGQLAVLLACACAPVMRPTLPSPPPRRAVRLDADEMRECSGVRGAYEPPHEEPIDDPELANALLAIEPEVRRVAKGAGVEHLLAALLHASAHGGASDALKLQLITRLSSLEIQIASMQFELDCLGDHMETALFELDRRQRKREVALAVSSIVVGAAAGTAGGIWDVRGQSQHGPPALVISGGVASAGLGLLAFVPERRAVVFPHPRNLLTPIITGQDPDRLYPPFVFRMMSMPNPREGTTAREDILEDWRQILADIPARDRALAESVLYGDGGLYDGDLVDVRERMFDVLESHINALDHELELLYRYATRIVETTGPQAPAR